MAIIKLEKVIKPIPHGANPDDYVAVRTADGIIYRRKRSKGTPLNAVCKKNQSKLQIASPLCRQIRKALVPYINRKLRETLHYRLVGCLMEGVKSGIEVDLDVLSSFDLLDLHRNRRVKPLLLSCTIEKSTLTVNGLKNPEVVTKHEKLLKQFRFKVFVITLREDGETVEVSEQQSPNFPLDTPFGGWSSPIDLPYPGKYLVCLKAECLGSEWVCDHQQTQYFKVLKAGESR